MGRHNGLGARGDFRRHLIYIDGRAFAQTIHKHHLGAKKRGRMSSGDEGACGNDDLVSGADTGALLGSSFLMGSFLTMSDVK